MRRPAGTPSTAATSSTEGDQGPPMHRAVVSLGGSGGGDWEHNCLFLFSVVWRHCNFWCVLWRVTTKPS